MSEIQSNQQQVETTEHTQVAQIQSVVFNQPEKVEETVALEISQLGGSSIISSEASHSVEHDVSKISSEGIDSLQPAGGSEDKREVSVTLTASNIQQDSPNNVSEIRQTKSETVQIEVTESKGAEQTENAAKVETTKTELTINTAAENNSSNAPKSPKDEKKEDLNPQTLQSPRQSTRRSASPAISRGKMDTVTKMLSKEEEKTKELDAKFAQLNAKKLQLEKALNEKIISQKNAHNKQEEQAKLVSEKDALRKLVEEKKQALKKIIQTRDHQEKEHQRELESIKNQNNHLQAEIEAKKKADQAKKTEYESKVAHLRNALQAQHEKLAALQSQHKGVQSKIQESSIKATQLTHTRQAALQKLTHSQQQKEQQQKAHNIAKENLLKRIAEVKEKINIKKEELIQTKNQNYSHLKEEHERINNEISRAQSESQELAVANKRLEEELTKKSKENNENKELEKKKQRKIIDLTKRSEQLTKKAHQFREEVIKLDSQKEEKKVIRYQEKIPEELLAIQAKNDALKKEIKQINERYAAEQAEMNKMVTPQIIQRMNKRISDEIAKNQKLAEVTKIIEDVTKENQKLATELDDLEWGENTHLKDLELERKRQQEKNKALEEELQAKKKQLQQLTYKLQQYVKEYPDFKPEKKKKPEPQPEPKGKKEEKGGKKTDKSPPAEENKKKKGNNDSVIEPKVEQAKVEEPKAAGKGKKKKGNSVSQVIEVKDPSPQPVQVKVQKNKVEVKPQVKSEIKSEKKVEEAKSEINQVEVKAEGKKEKKKKK